MHGVNCGYRTRTKGTGLTKAYWMKLDGIGQDSGEDVAKDKGHKVIDRIDGGNWTKMEDTEEPEAH